MKKSVLALAVLGAFAGVASAQSSVTLFGIVDVNVRSVKNDARTYQLGQDGIASSRLGFRGVEDLGGGLKASFWLEGALGPDTGTGSSSYGSATDKTNPFAFRRRSTVSLSNAWGELRLGRDYTATFWNWTVFDPFGTNGVGSSLNLAVLPGMPATGYGTLVRASNMVAYILPNGTFGPGLYGQVQAAAGETTAGNKYYGGRIGYAGGPFNVAASYGRTDVDVAGNATLDTMNVAGSWSFGFAKLAAFWGQSKTSDYAPPGFSQPKQQNWFAAITAPLGQYNLKASYGEVKGKGGLTGGPKATQWAVGADYNLSVRTALYATYSSINNKNGSVASVAAASPLSPGNNSSGGEVGVRHSF